MAKTKEKILSVILCVCMLVCYTPSTAFALEEGSTETSTQAVTEQTQPVNEESKDISEAEPTEPTKQVAPVNDSTAASNEIAENEQEEPQAEEEKEVQKYPAQTFTEKAGKLNVTVNAEEGSLPENSQMHISAVTGESALSALSGVKNIVSAEGLAISFTCGGKKVEPKSELKITISCEALEGDSFRFYRTDNGLTAYGSAKATGGSTTIDGDCTIILGGVKITKPALKAENEMIYKVTVGETIALTGTRGNYSNTWSSSSKLIATVSGNKGTGTVTGVAEGEATITNSYKDSWNGTTKTETFKVKVIGKPRVKLDTDSLKITAGESDIITAYDIVEDDEINEWTIDDDTIVLIQPDNDNESKCKVTGLQKGVTTITVTTKKGASASTTITVKPAAPKLNENSRMMIKTETFQITSDQELTYKSSNPSAATVSEDGLITAVKEGDAVITATAADGGVAFLTVTVLDFSIKTEPNKLAVMSDDEGYLYPYINASKDCSVEVESSNEDVITCEYDPKSDVCKVIAAKTDTEKTATVTLKLILGGEVIGTAKTQVTVIPADEEKTFHKIEFLDEFNTSISVDLVEDGEDFTAPKADKKEGKEFLGFKCGDVTVDSEGTVRNITSDMTFKATYERITHTVSFTNPHGETIADVEVNDNGHVILPKKYVKGYEVYEGGKYWQFQGWKTDDGDDFNQADPITEDIHLNGEWKKVTQTIYFVTYRGVRSSVEVDKGSSGSTTCPSIGKSDADYGYTYTSSQGVSKAVTFKHWVNSAEVEVSGTSVTAPQHKGGSTYSYTNIMSDQFFSAVYDPTDTSKREDVTRQDDYARLTLTVIDQFGNNLGTYNTAENPLPVYYDRECTEKVYDAYTKGLLDKNGVKQGYVNLAKDLGNITIDGKTYSLSGDNIDMDDFKVTWFCSYNDGHAYAEFNDQGCSGGTWTGVGVIKIYVEEYVPLDMSRLYVNYIGVDDEGGEFIIDQKQEDLEVGSKLTSSSQIKDFSAYGFKSLDWKTGEEGLEAQGGKAYTLNVYYQAGPYDLTVNFVNAKGKKVSDSVEEKLDFKEEYKVVSPKVAGYTATKTQLRGAMGKGSAEYDVLYDPNTDTPYTVQYFYQNEDGTYPDEPTATDDRTGTTDTTAKVTDADKVPTKNTHLFDADNENNVLSTNIDGDGNAVLKLYFKEKEKTKLTAESYEGTYDGNAHKLTVTPEEGATVEYSLDGGDTWSINEPSATDVADSIDGIWVRASKEGLLPKTVKDLHITINKREVTLKADDKEKTYGQDDPAFTYKMTDGSLVAEDDLGTIAASRISSASGAGTYENDIDVTFTGNGNYDVSVVKGTFKIKKAAAPEIKVSDNEKTYDKEPLTATIDVEGLEEDEYTLEYSNDGGATWSETPNSIINVSESGDNFKVRAVSDNYETVTKDYSLTVNQAEAEVSAKDNQKIYGTDDPELTAEETGVYEGDSISYSVGREKGENVGTYDITPSGNESQGNYHVTYSDAEFTIIAKTLTADLMDSPEDKTYNGEAHKWSPVIEYDGETLKEGTDYTVEYSTDDFTNVTGDITVTIKGKGNYAGEVEKVYKINPREIEVTADSLKKHYGESDPKFTGKVTDGSIISGDEDSLDIKYERTNSDVNDIGTYEGVIKPTYTENDNYNVKVVNGDFEITKGIDLGLEVTGGEKTYDSEPLKPTVSTKVKEGTTITYSTDGGTTWTDKMPSITDAGELSVTVKAENEKYEPETKTVTLKINQKDVTVTANDKKKIFGEDDPELTAKTEGTLNGDTVEFSTGREKGETAGEYDITPKGDKSQGNYNVSFEDGTLTILAQSINPNDEDAYLGITVDSPEDATYDGETHKWVPTVKDKDKNTLKEGVDYTVEYTTNDFVDAINEITVTIKGKGNYSGTVERSYKIDKREISFTVNNKEKTYGDADPGLTYEITDGSIAVKGDLGDVKAVRSNKTEEVGTYEDILNLFYEPNTNYIVNVKSGDFTILKQSIDPDDPTYKGIIVSDAPEKETFDGKEHKWNPVVTDKDKKPLKEGVDYTVEYDTDNFTDVNEGIKVTIKGIGSYDGTITREYPIDPAEVKVTADDKTIVFGDNDPKFTAKETGLIDDDKVTYDIEREKGTSAGTYDITPKGDEIQGNYKVTYEEGTLTIKPASINPKDEDTYRGVIVSDAPEGVKYDGKEHKWNPVVTDKDGNPLKEGVDYTVEYDTDDFVNADDEITVTIKGKGNYEGTIEKTYAIGNTEAVVTADNKEKVFGDKDPDFTAKVTGLVEKDTVKYEISREKGETVGDYDITPSGDKVQGNYDVSYKDGKLTIKAQSMNPEDKEYRGIIIPDAPKDITYDSKEHKWTPVITDKDGNILEEGKDYEIKYSTDDFTNVGEIEVTITGKGNYSGEVTRKYDVDPKEVTVTVDDKKKVFGDKDPELTYKTDGLLGDDTVKVDLEREKGESAGEYKISGTAEKEQGNYIITEINNGTLTIEKQSVDPEDDNYRGIDTDVPENPTYDGKNHKWNPVITDKDGNILEEGKDYEIEYKTDNFKDSGIIEVVIRGIGDYSGETTRTYEIKKAKIIIKADDKSKKQGEKDPKFTALIDGLIDGDSVDYSLSRKSGERVGKYAITPSGEAVQGNYEIEYLDGTLTIIKTDSKPAPVAKGGRGCGPLTGDAKELSKSLTALCLSLLGLLTLTFVRRKDEENNTSID